MRISEAPVAWWPVKVRVPVDDGKTAEKRVRAQFRVVSVDGLEAFLTGAPIHEVLVEHVLDWDLTGLFEDEDGKPLAFSPENLAAVLRYPFARDAFEIALARCSRGAAEGN